MSRFIQLLSAGLLLFVAAVIAVGIYGWWAFQPLASGTPVAQTFVVPKGQAISVIGERLAAAGLIKQPLVFRLWVKTQGLSNQIQAGSFELSPTMSLPEIAQALTQGTNDVWITIPEGWRVEELADYLAEQGFPDFDKEVFIELSQEGQMFPDTYLVPRLTTAEQLSSLLRTTFETKVVEGLAAEIAASEYSLEEALTMASLVEREAATASEMPQVAGVLWKRIELGMPLQVDATLQYIKGYNAQTRSWWTPPLAADKQIKSAFNTYLNPGLPPRPISSPGLAAIKASLKPAQTEYLFYIHDTQGKVHFATTLEEHNRNVQTYLR